ncbi:MAG TPA: glycosyltransferase [Azospirillum sp.]
MAFVQRTTTNQPTVSLLLSNYDGMPHLPRALAGLCGQTRPATEILVLDDGSADDSLGVIEAFAARTPGMTVLRNDVNRGLMYSIDRLLHAATGDYIVWAASDDELLPTFLERSMAALERFPQAGLCCSELVLEQADGTIRNAARTEPDRFGLIGLPAFLPPDAVLRRFARGFLPISSNTVVARRDAVLAAGGFPPALAWHADWFTFHAVALRFGVCPIPEALSLYRCAEDSYSAGGMRDPARQHPVLVAVADRLRRPENRDLRRAFLAAPSLLSVFGHAPIAAYRRTMRHWGLARRYRRWCAAQEATG